MPLSSRDMWGVLRGSCNEPFCDCRRYVVVCSPDDSAASAIRCGYCNHCPASHSQIIDLGGTEQESGVVEVPKQSSELGYSKDGTTWVADHPLSDISEPELDTDQQLGIACNEGVSQGITSSSAPRENFSEVPVSSKAGKALKRVHLSTLTLDTERIQVLLKVTYEDRCKGHDDTLPQYFVLENILCIEVELRFKSNIGDLEIKLKTVSEAFSYKERECTFVDIIKHLKGYSRLALISEIALPNDLEITAPHVDTPTEHTCVYAGSAEQVIWISNGNIERALIFCLLTYIKNLEYPPAFSPVLVLLRKIVMPDATVPRGLLTNRLKNHFKLLKKKNLF